MVTSKLISITEIRAINGQKTINYKSQKWRRYRGLIYNIISEVAWRHREQLQKPHRISNKPVPPDHKAEKWLLP